ncbi:MAG TPA: NAD(+) diphosphatase, partial [Gammaproteobacteria bacterium]|nr:NAD(+) diphosphatase [Gammaproteobacteria bacterium]
AVRREVKEETDIDVEDVVYLASQPWPFPSSLMIGFHARARSEPITLNDGELAEARWVSREEIAARQVRIPPAMSISFYLIEQWFNQAGGPLLGELAASWG